MVAVVVVVAVVAVVVVVVSAVATSVVIGAEVVVVVVRFGKADVGGGVGGEEGGGGRGAENRHGSTREGNVNPNMARVKIWKELAGKMKLGPILTFDMNPATIPAWSVIQQKMKFHVSLVVLTLATRMWVSGFYDGC